MQVKSLNRAPDASKRVIDAFLAQAPADPEAPVYEFASGDIIAMLEKLKDKFKDEKTVLESEEVAKVAAHDMLVQNLSGQTNSATEAKDSKTKGRAKNKSDVAQASSDLDDTTVTKDDDVKYLADVTATCDAKKTDFDARQKT